MAVCRTALATWVCRQAYTCHFQEPWPWEFDTAPYREASSRKDLCAVKTYYHTGNQKSLPGFQERCESSKSDVIYFCPKKDLPIEAKYRNTTMALNKKFKKYLNHKSTKTNLKRMKQRKKRKRSKRKKKRARKKRARKKRKGKKRLRKKRTMRKRKRRKKPIAFSK